LTTIQWRNERYIGALCEKALGVALRIGLTDLALDKLSKVCYSRRMEKIYGVIKENQMFKVGDKVCSILNAAKIGTVVETGLNSKQEIQWIRVRFEKGRRWVLADAVRPYSDIHSVFVPDGVVVLARHRHYPEVFQQPESKATLAQVQTFANEIYKIWEQRLPGALRP
jgi:hypothetical protein